HRTSNVTGTATLYYEDSALAEKAQTEERIAISFECKDGAGNKYVFAATKVKPSDAWPEISGPEDIMVEVALTFDPDLTTGTNVSITRVPKV
ncbi:MAG: phage tail tube protein, partial [Shewanella sp.]